MVVRRAILEAWAIHLRCLIEFFHANRDDVLRAEHYVADPAAWAKECPVLTRRERRRQKALHELLAHIAIGRNANKSRWSIRDHRIVRSAVRLGGNMIQAYLHQSDVRASFIEGLASQIVISDV